MLIKQPECSGAFAANCPQSVLQNIIKQTVPKVCCRISLWVAALLFNYFQVFFFFFIAAVVLSLSCIWKR